MSLLIYSISYSSLDDELDEAIVDLRQQLAVCTDELECLYAREDASCAGRKKLAEAEERLRDVSMYAGVAAFEKTYRLSVAVEHRS